MMMLAKLKEVAVLAVTALALTTGLGMGLVPGAAGEEPAPGARTKAEGAAAGSPANRSDPRPKAGRPDSPADDATFLRRLCLAVRGTPPTDVETWFFASDADADKRAKVVDWVTTDDAAKLALAKKLGVPPERVKAVRARLSADGQYVELSVDGLGARFVQPLALPATPSIAPVNPNSVKLAGDATEALSLGVRLNATETKPAKTTLEPKCTLFRRAALDSTAIGYTLQNSPVNLYVAGNLDTDDKAAPLTPLYNELYVNLQLFDSDAEFLKRVLADVRGGAPTVLETKYFTEDKDPKKREKLIDTLLKEPAVQKKLGDAWKAKMLEPKVADLKPAPPIQLWLQSIDQQLIQPPPITWPPAPPAPPVKPTPPAPPAPPAQSKPASEPDRYEKLVGVLIAAKKSDEAILEAVTLATLSRLPTDSEKKLVTASIGSAADRKAAWVAVARALAGSEGVTVPNAGYFQIDVHTARPPAPPTPPVPPAKP